MEDELKTLTEAWVYWNSLAKVPEATVSTDCSDCLMSFVCADQSFHIRRDSDWWVVDSVDDRGTRYDDIARFSSAELLVKYLVWLWGSSARSAILLPSLGAQFFREGRSEAVTVIPGSSEWKFEIISAEGRAILSEPELTIFTHVACRPLGEINRMLCEGLQ